MPTTDMALPETTGLALLRKPFPANQVSKLPKGTKAQNECDYNQKRSCAVCGGFHHPQVIHVDYVGHAALTDRLLDADPAWNWEPLAFEDGLPKFDKTGGLWIKLTVCGQTRLGYGHAATSSNKDIGSREKEVIGDALRNAAMRFGAALDLWHKGDLHLDDDDGNAPPKPVKESSKAIGTADFDKLPEDRKKVVADLSIEIIQTFRDTGSDEAYDMYLEAKGNLPLIEEQAALRGQFASDIKTTFQKIAAVRKAAMSAEDAMSTP